jgi:hypothetical protein
MCESITDWFHNMSTNDNNNVTTTSGHSGDNGMGEDDFFDQVIYILFCLIFFLTYFFLVCGTSRLRFSCFFLFDLLAYYLKKLECHVDTEMVNCIVLIFVTSYLLHKQITFYTITNIC